MNVILKVFNLLLVIILISCVNDDKNASLSEFKNANSLYIKGNTEEALKILEKIEKWDPDFIPALYLSGKIYLQKNNAESAEKKWKRIIRINPAHIQSGKQLLRLYILQKKYKEAETLLFDLISISADDPELLILAGKLRKDEKRYLEAIEFFSKAFLFEDRIMDAHIDIAEIYEKFGISDKSIMHLEKAASIGGEEHELYEPIMSVLGKKD